MISIPDPDPVEPIDRLTVRMLNVVDKNNNVRILLSADTDDPRPLIVLLDDKGRQRCSISINESLDCVSIVLTGSNGRTLSLHAAGKVGLTMANSGNEDRIVLMVDADGLPKTVLA